MHYHVVYIPSDGISQVQEQIVSIMKTDSAKDVLARADAIPRSIAMQLDACSEDELRSELVDLGFTLKP
jgi:hypothetical protein